MTQFTNRIIPLINVNDPVYTTNRTPLTVSDMGPDHKWNYIQRKMNFDKDLGLKGKYCFHPFNTITIDNHGDIYMCTCQAWLPFIVGNIMDIDNLDDIVKIPRTRELQASIIDGTYRYCDENSCGIIQSGELKDKISHKPDTINWINLALDSSCNLTCPSCRTEFKFINEGPQYEKLIKIVDKIIVLIEKHNHWTKFSVSNDGDPFASLVYRHFLSNLNVIGKPIEIEIITNGILAKAHWHKMAGIHKNITRFKVSFDAGSEAVYNITRRGGSWDKLIEGCQFISDWRKSTKSKMDLMASFVVQNENFRDMIPYVELCESLGFTEIYFSKIIDWGTFGNDFAPEAVWKEEHPNYAEFMEILHHPALKNPKVNLTNLNDLL
jgi:molybdenum cofactor biosynthesis enzyme MoaA